MSRPATEFYADKTILANKLASQILSDLKREGGTLILPGGSSPVDLIRKLGSSEIDWSHILVTTTDERCVPIEHDGSNAGQIQQLGGLDVYPLWENGQIADIDQITFPATVTILGMGPDAHIASLFPGNDIDMTKEGVIEAEAPFEPRQRVSLTMQALLNTKSLNLLVIGGEKWALCERILGGELADTPLARLIDIAGDKLTLHIVKD